MFIRVNRDGEDYNMLMKTGTPNDGNASAASFIDNVKVWWNRNAHDTITIAAIVAVAAAGVVVIAGGIWFCCCKVSSHVTFDETTKSLRQLKGEKRKKNKKTSAKTQATHDGVFIMDNLPRLNKLKYPGIRNVGNSCYLSSILQALASIHSSAFSQVTKIEELKGSTLLIPPGNSFYVNLDGVLQALNTPWDMNGKGNPTIDVSRLIKSMGTGMVSLSEEQQDAHEFLQAILCVLTKAKIISRESSLSRLKGLGGTTMSIMKSASVDTMRTFQVYPGIDKRPSLDSLHSNTSLPSINSMVTMTDGLLAPWEGILGSDIRCVGCGGPSSGGVKTVVFSMLTSLPIVGKSNLLESLVEVVGGMEIIPDYNCHVIDGCGKKGAGCLKTNLIYRWPKILIMQLQRSSIHVWGNGGASQAVKDETILPFPVEFQTDTLAPYADGNVLPASLRSPSINSSKMKYELMAVVEHQGHGSLNCGHYTAYRRVKSPMGTLGWVNEWIYASDSHVERVSLERVLSAQAYILIYRIKEE